MKKEDRIELQLSSGQGPAECELAVAKLLAALRQEFPAIEVLAAVPGVKAGAWRSVRVAGGKELAALEGSVKWVCESPYRPKHRRKNWFVDVSLCHQAKTEEYDETQVRFETFRCGGKGGSMSTRLKPVCGLYTYPPGLRRKAARPAASI